MPSEPRVRAAPSRSTDEPAVRVDPVALARSLHALFDVRSPREIDVAAIAYHRGARVLYREAGSADARVARSGDRAYLAVAIEARGTPRANFSIAHELCHHLMHAGDDSIERIHGAARSSGREFRVEHEANRFASELLVPWSLAAPLCNASPGPHGLAHVGDLARAFSVSLTVAAKRWAEMTTSGCAVVESRGDVVKWVTRSSGFRGEAFARRKLQEATLALQMGRVGGRGRARLHTRAWGSFVADVEILEECVPLGDGGAGGPVLTWLSHG